MSQHSYADKIETDTVTILEDETVSSVLKVGGMSLVGLIFPPMAGTTMSISGSVDGENFYPLYNDAGDALSFTIQDNSFLLFTPADLSAVRFIKLVAGTLQGSNKDIVCVMRALS